MQLEIYAIKYGEIWRNMQKYAFYMQKYMQKYVKIRTISAKTCINMQEICKEYARNMHFYMENMQTYMQKHKSLCFCISLAHIYAIRLSTLLMA